ncbi:MAG: hypothetical protein ACQER9_02195 [Nanobdellota archaeon]
MSFSESAGQLIMFIAVVTVAAGLVLIFNQYISQSTGAITTRQQYISNQLRTSIDIESVNYDSGIITAYAKNTGDTRFYPNKTTVYIDKERISYGNNLNITVEPDTDSKNPGILDSEEIMKLSIAKTLNNDETHEILLVSQFDARDIFEFTT